MRRTGALSLALALCVGAPSARADDPPPIPPASAFQVPVERVVLSNGLVVLLSRDPSAAMVAVSMAFQAGTEYEPPGRSGLAHLVEHVMAMGPTPETNYAELLERRGAVKFNALTTFDTMTFEVVLPASELPIALWANAERLGTLPPLIDEQVVEKNRRVIAQERNLVQVDAPYGLVDEDIDQRLYAAPHPLHGGVLGLPKELGTASAGDVRAFVARYLVPANAVLTIVGNFDPASVKPLLESELGRLPPGQRAAVPVLPPLERPLVEQRPEAHSRLPRVTLAWRFRSVNAAAAQTLQLGAYLLNVQTDGAWGMRIDAEFMQYSGEDTFRFDLTLPYDDTVDATQSDATSLVRFLTRREVDLDLLETANLALDRANLFLLDTLDGRAEVLTQLDELYGPRTRAEDYFTSHWKLDNFTIRDTARSLLGGPMVIVHSRPTRPRPPRKERD